MNNSAFFRTAAGLGFLAVALGAFGAHGLRGVLHENETAGIWEKAVLYHFVHTLMMCLLASRAPVRKGPWFCFLAGIALFCGSLYLFALTKQRWLTAITPLGGVSFLIGWAWLAICPKGDAA